MMVVGVFRRTLDSLCYSTWIRNLDWSRGQFILPPLISRKKQCAHLVQDTTLFHSGSATHGSPVDKCLKRNNVFLGYNHCVSIAHIKGPSGSKTVSAACVIQFCWVSVSVAHKRTFFWS